MLGGSPLELGIMQDVRLERGLPMPPVTDAAILAGLGFARLTQERTELPTIQQLEFGAVSGRPLDVTLDLKPHTVVPTKGLDNIPDQILSILLNRHFRKGPLTLIEQYLPILRGTIASAVEEQRPVTLTLLALAGKAAGPLGSGVPIQHTDLGEFLVMAQFRDMITSVCQVYAPGLQIVVMSDALAYVGIRTAEGTEKNLIGYVNGCRAIREQMGLRDYVAIVDLAQITYTEDRFESVRLAAAQRLQVLKDNVPEVRERLASLSRAMYPYISIDDDPTAAFQIIQVPYDSWPEAVRVQCERAAMSFASFTVAQYLLGVSTRAFPNALRGTVLPKNAPQLPLHLTSDRSVILPYNGVPVVSSRRLEASGCYRSSTTIIHRGTLMTTSDQVEAVYRPGDRYPHYYVHHNKN